LYQKINQPITVSKAGQYWPAKMVGLVDGTPRNMAYIASIFFTPVRNQGHPLGVAFLSGYTIRSSVYACLLQIRRLIISVSRVDATGDRESMMTDKIRALCLAIIGHSRIAMEKAGVQALLFCR
jgi:hypothetical protein